MLSQLSAPPRPMPTGLFPGSAGTAAPGPLPASSLNPESARAEAARNFSESESARLSALFHRLGAEPTRPVGISGAIASWHASGKPLHARAWHRVPWTASLQLTPLDNTTRLPDGDAVIVAGRDLSLGGLSFLHAMPLACRFAELRLACDSDSEAVCRVRLTWCRFTRDGMYQSGGRFLD